MNRFDGSIPAQDVDAMIRRCEIVHGSEFWVRLEIPKTAFRTPLKRQRSRLVRLPQELLRLILGYGDKLSTLCLALTCKELLQVTSFEPILVPSALAHRRPPYSPDCRAMHSLLQLVGPVDERGRPVAWLAVCSYCFCHRPTSSTYWEPNRVHLEQRFGTKFANDYISAWGSHAALQCPDCLVALDYIRNDKKIFSSTKSYHEWLRRLMLEPREEYSHLTHGKPAPARTLWPQRRSARPTVRRHIRITPNAPAEGSG